MLKKDYNFEFISMTTPCKVQLYKVDEKTALKCFEEIKNNTLYLENKYNFYSQNSYLSKFINNRNKNKIKLDSQTAFVLKRVRDFSIQTNNLFDITMGTIKKCYNYNSLDLVRNSLEKYLAKTGIESWDIINRQLIFKYKETLLDLGGVIKEYAVDEAINIVKKNKIDSAIINFGGDIFTIGTKANGDTFSIAIKNPKNPKENLVIVNIRNQALTTSANYERKKEIQGEEFSHILTKTKQQKDIISSTIISKSTLQSGIYSTSFMIDTNIDIPEDMKVVLIDKELKLHQNIQT